MSIIKEVKGLYKIISIEEFRKTPDVLFSILTKPDLPSIDSFDEVIHKKGAISPGKDDNGKRTWYMHPHQDDNLIVLMGERNIDIYSKAHGRIEKFKITPDCVFINDEPVCYKKAFVVWPKGVFHRIISGDEGSISVNLSTHYEGFDILTNFNIYNLDTNTGDYSVYRKGHLDQKV